MYFGVWADPDIGAAAEYMQLLLDLTKRKEIGMKGQRNIQENLSPEVVGELFENLVKSPPL